MTPPIQTLTNRITKTDAYLWTLASLFFITGDVLSTQAALTIGAGTEANPITRHIIHNHGWLSFLAAKTISFTLILAFWVVAQYLTLLDERKPLDTRLADKYPHTLGNVYESLPNDPDLPNNALLNAIPAIPLLLGAFLTINNILVATHTLTLHEAAISLLYLT